MFHLRIHSFDEWLAFENAFAFLKFVPSQRQSCDISILRQRVLNPSEDKGLQINGCVIRTADSHGDKVTNLSNKLKYE